MWVRVIMQSVAAKGGESVVVATKLVFVARNNSCCSSSCCGISNTSNVQFSLLKATKWNGKVLEEIEATEVRATSK